MLSDGELYVNTLNKKQIETVTLTDINGYSWTINTNNVDSILQAHSPNRCTVILSSGTKIQVSEEYPGQVGQLIFGGN